MTPANPAPRGDARPTGPAIELARPKGWIDPAAVAKGARQVERAAYQLGLDDAATGDRRGHQVPPHFRAHYLAGYEAAAGELPPPLEDFRDEDDDHAF